VHYDLIDGGKRGRLQGMEVYHTPIKGHDVILPDNPCAIDERGQLILGPGFVWDFGSYAIDTPSMVYASAMHDACCIMTDRGLLPWACRSLADSHFRELLAKNGTGFARRWWCYFGVRGYSEFVARRKRVKA